MQTSIKAQGRSEYSTHSKVFRYKPATTVEDGINRFVAWYRNYYAVSPAPTFRR